MPTERTGQPLKTLLGAAKARGNQTDHDTRLKQQSRNRDANLAAKKHKPASQLEQAQMELTKARDVLQMYENEATSKNTDPIAFDQLYRKVEASRKKVNILTQKVDQLSSQQKTSQSNQEKTAEIQKFSVNIKRAATEVSQLRNDLRNINEKYTKAVGIQKDLTNKFEKVETELSKNTTELEKLKNQGPIKQFPLFKLFVNKQKEHDKKIVNLEQQNSSLEKEKNNLTSQLKKLPPKIAELDNQIKNLSKDIAAKDEWIKKAKHKMYDLTTQVRESQAKKNDNKER